MTPPRPASGNFTREFTLESYGDCKYMAECEIAYSVSTDYNEIDGSLPYYFVDDWAVISVYRTFMRWPDGPDIGLPLKSCPRRGMTDIKDRLNDYDVRELCFSNWLRSLDDSLRRHDYD